MSASQCWMFYFPRSITSWLCFSPQPLACVENLSINTALQGLMELLLQNTEGSSFVLNLMEVFSKCVQETRKAAKTAEFHCRVTGMDGFRNQLQVNPLGKKIKRIEIVFIIGNLHELFGSNWTLIHGHNLKTTKPIHIALIRLLRAIVELWFDVMFIRGCYRNFFRKTWLKVLFY